MDYKQCDGINQRLELALTKADNLLLKRHLSNRYTKTSSRS